MAQIVQNPVVDASQFAGVNLQRDERGGESGRDGIVFPVVDAQSLRRFLYGFRRGRSQRGNLLLVQLFAVVSVFEGEEEGLAGARWQGGERNRGSE